MDGKIKAGWYLHPNLGLIKVYEKNRAWVYQCYKRNGSKPVSRERDLDQWTWALSEPSPEEY